MKDIIELHTHTHFSDGDYSPERVIEEAVNNNVGILSFTDHDTLLGVQHAYETMSKRPLVLIPGIELSAFIGQKEGRLHILGYGIDIYDKKLNQMTSEMRQRSIAKIEALVKYLENKYGSKNNPLFQIEDLNRLYNPIGDVGRRDVAKLLIQYGRAKDEDDAFDNYLNEANQNINIKEYLLHPDTCINLILQAGGIPVLAHPVSLKKTSIGLGTYISSLKRNGLAGIELYHYKQDRSYQEGLLKLLRSNDLGDLLISGGSDFHGPTKPAAVIGSMKVKQLSILDDPRIKHYL